MCTIVQKYANTGLVNISTANSSLTGSGTLGTVLTSPGGVDGTKINSITIKATGNTTQGMVRLFTYDGASTYFLWKEIRIPANTQSATIEAFQTTIYKELVLDSGHSLMAATQNAESFNVYANGVDWTTCECSDTSTCGDQKSIAYTGLVNIATANSRLDGGGTIGTILTAPSGTLVYGTQLFKINVKAIVSTSQGMVRLYINNGSTNFLIWEIPIPATTQSNVQPAYRTLSIGFIDLKSGYSLSASTQNADSFNVIVFASNITNCACA